MIQRWTRIRPFVGLAMDVFQYFGLVKELEVLRLEFAATRHNVKAWGIALVITHIYHQPIVLVLVLVLNEMVLERRGSIEYEYRSAG